MKSRPSRIPTPPPPCASVAATSAIPSASVKVASIRVEPRRNPLIAATSLRDMSGARHGSRSGTDFPQASRGFLSRCHHHAAGGVLQDVVDGLAEDVAVAAAGGAEDDDLRLAALRLLDDRPAGAARADDAVDHAHTVRLGG